jgi:hypothetical protein
MKNSLHVSATEKVALLIGNDKYTELSDLNTPSNDVATIAAILKDIGFKVLALHNLTLNEMRNAVREFCQLLPEGGYGKTSLKFFIIFNLAFLWMDYTVNPEGNNFCCTGLEEPYLCQMSWRQENYLCQEI